MSARRGRFTGLRIGLGVALLTFSAALAVAMVPVTVTYADQQATALDEQVYVPDAGADQYQADAASGGGCSAAQCPAPDPNAVHVGAAPAESTYHALLHVEIDQFKSETLSSLVITLNVLTPATTPQDNVNTAAAVLDAYPLATKLDTSFQGCSTSVQCSAPAADTSGPKIVGKSITDASGNITGFSFDIGRMLPYWQSKGEETGIAIVPDAADTTQPWDIAFDKTQSTASATVQSSTPPLSSSSSSSSTTTAPYNGGSGGFSGGGGSTAVVPSTPAAVSTPTATATPKPSPSRAPAVTTITPSNGGGSSGGGVPLWLVVLGVSATAAVALLAQPVSQALSSSGGLRLNLLRELKIHPRMFAVAGTLLVWSSAWGVYSGATGASLSAGSHAANSSTATSSIPSYAPDLGTSPTAGPSGSAAPGSTAGPTGGGGGGGSTINGAPVGAAAFASANVPPVPSAQLYTGADNTVGITDTSIQMCAHAALTFGPAFNIGAADLNVFWQMVNDPSTDPYPHTAGQGGIYNRKIVQPGGADGISIQDDGYQPSKAVQAAQACQQQQGGDFFLLSGIGFDQIPNVRIWAEQNHMIYIHHIATAATGLQYSFTMLPTLQEIGTQYGEYYVNHLKGQKVGIIERASSNWSPGVAAFKAYLSSHGVDTTNIKDDQVSNNQGDYSKEIVDMQTNGVQAVFIWENALAADSIIQQAANQNYTPKWLMFPFNLTLYTLNQAGNNSQTMNTEIAGMQGLVPWPAYTSSPARCQSGGSGITRNDADYGQYSQEIAQFEAAYAKLDPKANMCGDGGDLLFGTWEAWKQVADLLVKCGPQCDRNKIAGLMESGYKSQVGANCPVDFSGGDHHEGGIGGEDVYVTKQENGGPGWVNTGYCEATVR